MTVYVLVEGWLKDLGNVLMPQWDIYGLYGSKEEAEQAQEGVKKENKKHAAYDIIERDIDLRGVQVWTLFRHNHPEAGGKRAWLGVYLSENGAKEAMLDDIQEYDGAYEEDDYDILSDTLNP